MEEEDQEKKAPKPITMKGFTQILLKLDSEAAHTSFGKLPMSKEASAPQFGFSKAKQADGDKVFLSEDIARTANACKHSPGPIYDVREDSNKYAKAPGFGFGSSSRMAPTKPKYDHYENERFLDDPIEAERTRAPKCLAPKIGTEPRMQQATLEKNPGPQYYPGDRPEKKKSSKYTFGHRRDKGAQNSLKVPTSTPGNVGPGRYVPEASANPSNKRNFPKWTLPKAGRPAENRKKADKNQTYDQRSGVGKQAVSKNRSAPSAHFGTAGRAAMSKMGTFKDSYTGAMKVIMPHNYV